MIEKKITTKNSHTFLKKKALWAQKERYKNVFDNLDEHLAAGLGT